MTVNMNEVLRPVAVDSESSHQEAIDPVTEYQQWYMKMKLLVRESQSAKEKGELKKAQDLFREVTLMTREYCDKRIARK
jgi:hypothetical protein